MNKILFFNTCIYLCKVLILYILMTILGLLIKLLFKIKMFLLITSLHLQKICLMQKISKRHIIAYNLFIHLYLRAYYILILILFCCFFSAFT